MCLGIFLSNSSELCHHLAASDHSLPSLCLCLFFVTAVVNHMCPIDTVCAANRWYKLLQENMSPVQLVDLSYMNKRELPLPRPPPSFDTPVLTMLGDHDGVVDFEAAQETAQHFGQAEAVKLKGVAHDLMLVRAVTILSNLFSQKACLGLSLLW